MKTTVNAGLLALVLGIQSILSIGASLANAQNHGENKLQLHGISITGSGLQLVGTVLTLTADEEKGSAEKILKYTGYGLIVLGSLLHDGNLKFATSKNDVGNSDEVWKSMKRDCSVASRQPSIAAGVAIGSAAQQMDLFAGQSDEDRVKGFCKLISSVSKKSNSLEKGTKFSPDLASEIVGGEYLSSKDENAIKNMFALAGVI